MLVLETINTYLKEYPMLVAFVSAMAAVISAIMAWNANKLSPKDRFEIVKYEWITYNTESFDIPKSFPIKFGEVDKNADFLNSERTKALFPSYLRKGFLKHIFKSRRYNRNKWKIFLKGAYLQARIELVVNDFERI
ncbi:MAG: hypothetical protein OXH00_16645 [Candidatus Poribacteria bacterium]|nr:hypothetical protein [Candidatus Poribacteria bacterium]